MTKNLLSALVIASAIFVGCDQAASTSNETTATSTSTSSAENTDRASGNIVYINTDSLVRGYDYFIDLKAAFDQKAATVEKELDTKSRSLERKITDYQTKISKGLVTQSQAMELERKLTTEQQEVIQYRDKVVAELQEEEQVMFNKINFEITTYLEKFNAMQNYDLIIGTNALDNTVMIGNKKLDITATVLKGLNEEYKAQSK
ncbi:MAG: OmpH family outer membrane protein [Rikenellaceae bacterium]